WAVVCDRLFGAMQDFGGDCPAVRFDAGRSGRKLRAKSRRRLLHDSFQIVAAKAGRDGTAGKRAQTLIHRGHRSKLLGPSLLGGILWQGTLADHRRIIEEAPPRRQAVVQEASCGVSSACCASAITLSLLSRKKAHPSANIEHTTTAIRGLRCSPRKPTSRLPIGAVPMNESV